MGFIYCNPNPKENLTGDGRYSEDNFRYSTDRGYSRDSLLDKINYMAQSAVDEHERRVLMDCANKLR